MLPTTESKTHKIVLKTPEGKFEKILLSKLQHGAVLSAIQSGQQFITIGELGKTFKKRDIEEISKIMKEDRQRMNSKTPVLRYEDMYIVDNIVQKHEGEIIWERKRVQGGRTLETKYFIYKDNGNGVRVEQFINIL